MDGSPVAWAPAGAPVYRAAIASVISDEERELVEPGRQYPRRSLAARFVRGPHALILAALALGTAGLAVAAPAAHALTTTHAAARTDKPGNLSPRLLALSEQSSRAAAAPRARAAALSLPARGVGSLVVRPDGRVLVEIRTIDEPSRSVARLRDLGAQIVNVSAPFSTITAAILPSDLSALADDPAIRYVSEVLTPQVARVDTPQARPADPPPGCTPIVSEGDTLMNVAAARSANNLDGTGETVGVLSDSYAEDFGAATQPADDVAGGELPGPANPCGYTSAPIEQTDSNDGGTDEGRAMLQLVHGLAPGAQLIFASATNGEFDFASEIETMWTVHHANVIVDDIAYLDEPFFQDGPVANEANAASTAGVAYFSAAGNSNVIVGGHNVSSYETPSYRPTTCPADISFGETVLDCHNFDATGGVGPSDQITLAAGGGFGLDLQWAEPWDDVSTDFDAFVVNDSGTVLAESTLQNVASGAPFEFLGYDNTTGGSQSVRIVIARHSGSAHPRMKFVMAGSDGITGVQYDTSVGGDIVGPSIFGHSGAAAVGSTAAIPYDNSTTSEDFSSRGPETLYFQPAPSALAFSTPEVLAKPDFAATDDVQTDFFGDHIGSVYRFSGTSAAAPQAAAVAALIREKDPLLQPAAIMTIMRGTARAVANNGTPDAVGGGYLDATAALDAVTAVAGPPQSVTAIAGDASATIRWQLPPTDGGIPIAGYAVTPRISGLAKTPQIFNSTALDAVVTGLTNGATYTFTVAAINANGPGMSSSASSSVKVGAPSVPRSVVAISGKSRATLTWVAPAAVNGAPITGYDITPILAGVKKPPVHVGRVTAHAVTGLTNGDSYTFALAAVNSRGDGTVFTTAPLVVGLPDAPTNLVASPIDHGAKISYTPAVANGVPIQQYQYVIYDNSVFAGSGTIGLVGTQEFILGDGDRFQFDLAAVTALGNGQTSAMSPPIVVGSPTAPGAPHAQPGNGQVTLRWAASTPNGSPITSYVVTPYLGTVAQPTYTFPSTATSAVVTGLTNAKTYAFKIAAVNARGTGPQSTATAAITVGAPTGVAGVSAKAGHRLASVQWLAPGNDGAPITGYVVTPYLAGVAQPARVFHTAATSELITGLVTGKKYTFTVAATNSRGRGPVSAASNLVTVK